MGRAVARKLMTEGADLALTDISQTRLSETLELLSGEFPARRAVGQRADVTKANEAGQVCDLAESELGVPGILVNLVGGIRSTQLFTPFLELAETQWQQTFDLNLLGSFHLIQRLAPAMLDKGSGRIVNIASIAFSGEAGQVDYAAAKAAVASMTRSLAAEFAPRITVNCIAPGLTRTSVTERLSKQEQDRLIGLSFDKRMAEPSETADAVCFFCSGEARFVTGEIMAVSGGVHPHL